VLKVVQKRIYLQKVILFDLDGTLIDSTEAILESFKRSFEYFGDMVPKEEDILPQIGYPLFDMFVNLGVSRDIAQKYVDKYKENYKRVHTKKTTLLSGAKEAIKLAYSSGALLGVVTTKTGKYSIELLEHFNLMQYFSTLVGSEDVKEHKPNPQPINLALSRLNVTNSSNVYMIGDTCMDMIAAKRAGIKAIGVEFKYTQLEELKECSNVIECGVFEAVSNILNKKKY
jgi:phosphoglycolate phosphatase